MGTADLETETSADETSQISELGDDQLYVKLRQWFVADSEHSQEWRDDAKKAFGFVAGEQWEKKTTERMENEGRPAITFNRVLPIIKAVSGIEINTRQETVYLPMGTDEGEVIANEVLSQTSDWMSAGCDGKHQESRAFQDVLKCGMGWVEERLDYELDPDGKYVEELSLIHI